VNLPNLSVLPGVTDRNASVLLEKMGRMLAQLHEFRPQRLVLRIPPEFDRSIHELLAISAIKGYLSNSSDDYVSYVNARLLFEGRGLTLSVESFGGHEGGGRSTREIQLEVGGAAAKEQVLLGAVLYDGRFPRLTLINEFEFETEPSGELLVVTNLDRPGVVGNIGTFLASLNVNIAQFDLSRNQTGGEAMSVIRIDSGIDDKDLKRLEKIQHVIKVKRIKGL
jgi:D-3-phosphoglycerate dehydrogenase